jgi:putative holliday junction resolvase
MPTKALLGLDVGDRRIGVARATTDVKLALQENIAILVVGLPRGMDGQETAQTAHIRKFAKELGERLTIPLHMQDEAVTSVKAEETLKARGRAYKKEDIDALAASYILQDFIDTHPEEL